VQLLLAKVNGISCGICVGIECGSRAEMDMDARASREVLAKFAECRGSLTTIKGELSFW
jgi:hypothetical protein